MYARRTLMFSRTLAAVAAAASATVAPGLTEPAGMARFSSACVSTKPSASATPVAATAAFETSATSFRNCSFLLTKSVSAFTSTIAARWPQADTETPTRPSAATRPAFFEAAASPRVRSSAYAASGSNDAALRAFLTSIRGAPVFSRRSLIIASSAALSRAARWEGALEDTPRARAIAPGGTRSTPARVPKRRVAIADRDAAASASSRDLPDRREAYAAAAIVGVLRTRGQERSSGARGVVGSCGSAGGRRRRWDVVVSSPATASKCFFRSTRCALTFGFRPSRRVTAALAAAGTDLPPRPPHPPPPRLSGPVPLVSPARWPGPTP